eukprot:21686_1
MHPAQIISLISWCICGIGTVALLLVSYWNHKKQDSKINTSVLIYSSGAIISFFANCITAPIYQQSDSTYNYYLPCQVLSLHLWTWGCLFTYIVLIGRIKLTKATVYAPSNWVFILSYILVAIFFIFECTEQMVLIIFNYNVITPIQYGNYLAICIWSIEFVDLILCIMLITIFVKKLMLATITIGSNDIHCDGGLNGHQCKLLYAITKTSFISIIAAVTAQLMLLYWVLFHLIFYSFEIYFKKPNLYLWFHHIGYILWSLHCFIGSLMIFFSFTFNKNWYNFCCGKCHELCLSYCGKTAIRKSKVDYELTSLLITHKSDDYIAI